MSELRFDGKVALVTGAGSGLGRQYALAYAARGAKVVVNDLGGDIKGGGKSSRAADAVVDEIRAFGGTAVANYDSVEDGEKLVKTALDNFGRIDIVINNAGILRDRSFARISDGDWDIIQRVHLRGSFLVTRAAWPHMKDNKYGRIIMTTSSAGLYGNFGQANYSAAKLGLLGLSNTLAKEGQKYNINCNTIAPVAGTRLLATVAPEDVMKAMKPDYVAPFVLWLTHDSCEDSGKCFEVGGGWAAPVRLQRAAGVMIRKDKNIALTPEQVRDNWEKINDFEVDPEYPTVSDASAKLYGQLVEIDNAPDAPALKTNNTSGIDPVKAVGARMPPSKTTYTDNDVMLYALGVGVSTTQPDHLKFIYESHEDFCTLPTFVVQKAMESASGAFIGGDYGIAINPAMILHGEQYLEVYKPIPTSGTLESRAYIADVLDKGKGALILVNVETFDERGEKIAFNQVGTFVQKAGGFGGKRSSDKQVMPADAPNRAPDTSVKQKTNIDQAALYRLHGDRNPLHLDPSFAAMGGFSKPILHGLCSFGHAVRHVLEAYAGNDVTKFKSVKVRFSRPVYPGETIQTDMWKEGNRVYFQSKVVETGQVSISGAYVDLHGTTTPCQSAAGASSLPTLATDAIFEEIKRRSANSAVAKKVNACIGYEITKDGKVAKVWTIDLKKDMAVYEGPCRNGKVDLMLTISDENFMDMATGKLDGQKAFLSGKLKAKGNIMLGQKLSALLKDEAKL